MGTVRKLAAALACTALLTVVGATTAGADPRAKCARLDELSERRKAQTARVEARVAAHPRAAALAQKHQTNLEDRRQDRLATLQAHCSG